MKTSKTPRGIDIEELLLENNETRQQYKHHVIENMEKLTPVTLVSCLNAANNILGGNNCTTKMSK